MAVPRGTPSPWMLVPMAALYAVLYLGEEALHRPHPLAEWFITTLLALLALLPPYFLGWGVGRAAGS